ncbi:MAG: hypothetical protein JNM40_17865 [Myxococcales bacterium]|nr:hypothetical protein [Myxococcales bacterium]
MPARITSEVVIIKWFFSSEYYFVMKYVDGETLEHIIQKLADGDPYYHSRYPVEVRLEIFMGLLRALQYAHDQGIVHRGLFQ